MSASSAPRGLILDFGGVLDAPQSERLLNLVADLRSAGVKVAILSNASGPEARWIAAWGAPRVDAVLVSTATGTAKPQATAYELAASTLSLLPRACVFVDDAFTNVRGATATGMRGVLHVGMADTVAELTRLFQLSEVVPDVC